MQPHPLGRKEAAKQVEKSNASVADKQREIRDSARAKAAEVLREARGIAEPQERETPRAQPAEPKAESAKPAAKPTEQEALITRLASTLSEKQAQAQAQLEAAQRARQEADAKLAELKAAQDNPLEFLNKNGIDLDTWQARLLNGGEITAEEKSRRELLDRIAKVEAENKSFKEQQEASLAQAQFQGAAQALAEPLKADFPLVNRFMGPEQALQHLRELQSKQGNIDAKAAIAELEKGFREGLMQTLQDPAIAATIDYSPKTSLSEKAAYEGPRTITNTLTSSTSPTGRRTTLAEKRELAKQLMARMHS